MPAIASGHTGRTACCYLPHKNVLGILTPAQCKYLKGQVVPQEKRARAEAMNDIRGRTNTNFGRTCVSGLDRRPNL